MKLTFTIDRIDELQAGGIVVIDYKTSTTVHHNSWSDDRISEPQLPIYAAIALKAEKVVGVCFAKIRADESKFIGFSEESNVLPNVYPLAKVRDGSKFVRFEDWDALFEHWDASVRSIAQEIKSGVASVTFVDEADLAYCEVKPLLRLPERQLQFEQMQATLSSAEKGASE